MNPLFDHPTHRMLRGILREQEEAVEWGEAAWHAVARAAEAAEGAERFRSHGQSSVEAAGGIFGDDDVESAVPPTPRWDGTPYEIDPAPRRDERFSDIFNATALIDEYYVDEDLPPDERSFALAYKRLREMDVPEWMGPILYAAHDKPWDYHRDLARQLWDETRHAMMGETALVAAQVPFYA